MSIFDTLKDLWLGSRKPFNGDWIVLGELLPVKVQLKVDICCTVKDRYRSLQLSYLPAGPTITLMIYVQRRYF
jgi:hypothetical protein